MNFDVIIIGGGYNGLSLAGMLANAGIKVCLIEKNNLGGRAKNSRDPARLLAIAKASCQIYKKYKLLSNIDVLGQGINHIRVVDHDSHAFIDFDPKDINIDNFGYMVEEYVLGEALYKRLKASATLRILTGHKCGAIHYDANKVRVEIGPEVLTAKLLVAADGRNSSIRALAGIDNIRQEYDQCAVICDVSHALDHLGIAVEKFMPSGPFAILPKKGGFSSSIVWTLPKAQAGALAKLSENEVLGLLQDRFAGYLGELKLASELKMFPLELVYARKYYGKRLALLGDALHAIHPLAGQGLNLSLRDADALAQLIIEQSNLGLDIGSEHMLKQYQTLREPDNLMMIEGTDKLNWLFANEILPLKLARRFGLKMVNKLPLLKKLFMKYASGF
jgi:2-octaprenyl-6-methoxyphenol hydroxylase